MRKSSSLHFLLAFHPPSICSLTFLTNACPSSWILRKIAKRLYLDLWPLFTNDGNSLMKTFVLYASHFYWSPPFVTPLWSAHGVCGNNVALAKHHQITTRTQYETKYIFQSSDGTPYHCWIACSNPGHDCLLNTKEVGEGGALSLNTYTALKLSVFQVQGRAVYDWIFICVFISIPTTIY